jgi:hypothetical protein
LKTSESRIKIELKNRKSWWLYVLNNQEKVCQS